MYRSHVAFAYHDIYGLSNSASPKNPQIHSDSFEVHNQDLFYGFCSLCPRFRDINLSSLYQWRQSLNYVTPRYMHQCSMFYINLTAVARGNGCQIYGQYSHQHDWPCTYCPMDLRSLLFLTWDPLALSVVIPGLSMGSEMHCLAVLLILGDSEGMIAIVNALVSLWPRLGPPLVPTVDTVGRACLRIHLLFNHAPPPLILLLLHSCD